MTMFAYAGTKKVQSYYVRDAEFGNGWHIYDATSPEAAVRDFAAAHEVNHGSLIEVKGLGNYRVAINVVHSVTKVNKGQKVG